MQYNIIYADPPWWYHVWSDKGRGRTAASHYPTMSLQEIKSLAVSQIAAPDCVLFLWATSPNLLDAIQVIHAWGFRYCTIAFVWVKRNRRTAGWFWGLGYWTRSNAELCLLATRGRPRRTSACVHQVIDTPVGRHSSKPDEVRDRIVQLMGDLPRVELFARPPAASGWDQLGNEMDGRDIREALPHLAASSVSPHQLTASRREQ